MAQDLRGLLQEGKWREALQIYDQFYQPQAGKQDYQSLGRICRGLLQEAVKSNNSFDRIYAAGALVEQGDFSYLAILEESRLADDAVVRISAYQELIEVSRQQGRHEAIAPLLKQAFLDKDEIVRIQMLETLKRMENKDPSLLPHLEELLEDQSPLVRAEVAEILGDMVPSSAVTPLEKALQDEDGNVKLTALSSLVRIGKTAYLEEFTQAAIDKKNPGIRKRAAGLMGRLKHSSMPPLLRKQLKEEKDPIAQITIAASLGELGDKTGLPILQKALQGPVFLIRLNTVKAMGRARQPFFLPLLKQALQNEDPIVRTFAILFLGEAKDKSALPLISQALEDQDPGVRMSSAQILGELGNPAHTVSLRKALHDKDAGVVIFTSRALNRILKRQSI